MIYMELEMLGFTPSQRGVHIPHFNELKVFFKDHIVNKIQHNQHELSEKTYRMPLFLLVSDLRG